MVRVALMRAVVVAVAMASLLAAPALGGQDVEASSWPDAVTPIGGSGQSALAATEFPRALRARVTDAAGAPLAGVAVVFQLPDGGPSGSFDAEGGRVQTVTTGQDGVASSGRIAAGAVPGLWTAEAFVEGTDLRPATFELLNLAPDRRRIEVGPSPGFGPVAVGLVGTTQALSLRNAGTERLVISGVALDGPDASDFRVVGEGCTAGPLAPGGGCVVDLAFAPSTVGAKRARLVVASDADAGPAVVELVARGVDPDAPVPLEPVATSRQPPRPVIDSVVPAAGALAGGTRVVVRGSSFTDGTRVWFGRREALRVTVRRYDELVAIVPPGTTPGAARVTVESPGGRSEPVDAARFTYLDGPTP